MIRIGDKVTISYESEHYDLEPGERVTVIGIFRDEYQVESFYGDVYRITDKDIKKDVSSVQDFAEEFNAMRQEINDLRDELDEFKVEFHKLKKRLGNL